MKETFLFEYSPSGSRLDKISPLLKLLSLLVICIAASVLPAGAVLMMPALFIPLFIIAGRPAASQLAAGWKLYIFFALSGFIKFLTSGSATEGLAFASMLLVMFFSGILFYSTTAVGDFRRALTRLLRPIPSGGGTRLSELIAMTMAFLPLIFRTSSELSEAEYSRGFRPGKNPLRTLKIKNLPLLIHLFQKSDEMADAYYSRGYGCSSEKKK